MIFLLRFSIILTPDFVHEAQWLSFHNQALQVLPFVT